jgi:hypothetical protein
MLRYVIRMPPLAEAPAADILRWLGPALQGHLDGGMPASARKVRAKPAKVAAQRSPA